MVHRHGAGHVVDAARLQGDLEMTSVRRHNAEAEETLSLNVSIEDGKATRYAMKPLAAAAHQLMKRLALAALGSTDKRLAGT